MCGIVGYVGARPMLDTLISGLKRLEYRGYDSAGLAVLEDGQLRVAKSAGKVAALEKRLREVWPGAEAAQARVGVAHTRWATHGAPTDANAHPHLDGHSRFAVVHNGIIENYAALRERLTAMGHTFRSQTDTEVIPHLIAACYEGDLVQAVAAALKQVRGTFGLAVVGRDHPGLLVVARQGSPIVLGVGDREMIVASDVAALVSCTRRVIYLNDGDIAAVRADGVDIRSLDNVPVSREMAHIDWDPGAAEKQGHPHFMLKEMFDQPEAIRNAMRGRLDPGLGTASLQGLNLTARELVEISRVIIAACGTSRHAGMVGEYYFEDLADLVTEIEQAAEFRYRNPIITPPTLVLAISQSGETADTLAAVREAKQKGAIVASLCNVVGSTIARETGRGIYLHAGPEISVASTKAFTCQVTVLLMAALKFGRARRLSRQRGLELVQELEAIPELVQRVLDSAAAIERVARRRAAANSFFYIGRGYLYPVALEGALKLKEISYVHAEGYHAAELKHGPIALLDPAVPVMALANDIPGKEKTVSNMQECRARGAPILATATVGDEEVRRHADEVLWLPPCSAFVAPIVTVVALQLFAYYVASERGCPIDQPRNLAKSVTVE